MKIYTKKGDQGQTSLFGGGTYPKDNLRIETYGTVDELNSIVGLITSQIPSEILKLRLLEIQKQLFTLGAELATLNPPEPMLNGFLQNQHITQLEKDMDTWEQNLKPLTHFILPGGTPTAAAIHLARTVCRRAERMTVALSHQDPLRAEVLQYLNRLSDWFFMLARFVNHQAQTSDILWEGILS